MERKFTKLTSLPAGVNSVPSPFHLALAGAYPNGGNMNIHQDLIVTDIDCTECGKVIWYHPEEGCRCGKECNMAQFHTSLLGIFHKELQVINNG
jgi:hypothetical protein